MSSEWVKQQEKRFASESVVAEALQNPVQRERIDVAMKFIGGPNLKVIDVGCGDGGLSEIIRNQGNEVWGMDLPDVVDTVPMERRTWLSIIAGDVSKAPWLNAESFLDVVFAGELVEHLIDVEPFFTEAWRVLKPGGRLVLTTPNAVRELNRLAMLFGNVEPWHEWRRIPHHVRFWTPETIQEAVVKYGFKPLEMGTGRSQAENRSSIEDQDFLSPEERRVLRKVMNKFMPTPVWKHSFIVLNAQKVEKKT